MSREVRLPLFRERIVSVLRHAFPECVLFENADFINELYTASMHFLEAGQEEHLNLYADKYHATYTSVKEKQTVRLVFAACCVLITSRQERSLPIRQETPDVPALLHNWRTANTKDFNHITFDEISLLVNFRRTIKVALLIVAPNLNKLMMINIACRLQSTPEIYSFGSGKCAALRRRVTIYELESGVTEEHRPYRAVGMTKAEYYQQQALAAAQGEPPRTTLSVHDTMQNPYGQVVQARVEPARAVPTGGSNYPTTRQPHVPVNTGLEQEPIQGGTTPTYSEDILNLLLMSVPTRDYDYSPLNAGHSEQVHGMFDTARLSQPTTSSSLPVSVAVPPNGVFTQSIYDPIPAAVDCASAASEPMDVSHEQSNSVSVLGLTYSDQIRLQECLPPSLSEKFF